ncbi:MAG: hypothetical protein M3N10_05420 [Actinomycetota bacterium]|nr:hypothetical protein [Actinomycetota bacterium]HZY65207.1 hypothetical protein [Rubrobacteraceae bacterium]
MDVSANHVVIAGGPEAEEELLAIVLDDGDAVPIFDSVEEAEEFLVSTGDFGADWHALEVSAGGLIQLLEYQGDEVEYVALSPPPERLEGGMEVQVVPLGAMISLLERQTEVSDHPPEEKGFWRRLFRR